MKLFTEVVVLPLTFGVLLVGCSAMADFALSQVAGSNDGISAEVVVGDKEQVLGTNQDVKAEKIEKVIGTSDNSVVTGQTEEVNITNNTFPTWGIGALALLALLVGWLLPRPALWKRAIQRKTHE